MRVVYLRNGVERKIKNFYPWIFRDEVKEIVGEEGYIANVFSRKGDFLGKGFFSKSHITVRMLTSKDEEIDEEFFLRRIRKARLKRNFPDDQSFRLVHAEGDFLPGVIVDKYKDGFVVQFRTKGAEALKEKIVNAILGTTNASFIYERSDFETSSREDLERRKGPLYGKTPEVMTIEENSLKFIVDIAHGQKTGFFFDQRKNRKLVRTLPGKSALDLYTYTGGFALNLAASGFDVTGVDKSEDDIEIARENARINNLKVEFVSADVFEFLRRISRKFDVVIADPPSLIKKKSEKKKAISILSQLTNLVKDVLNIGGIFVVCSCAYNIDMHALIESMRRGIEGEGLIWNILNITYQDTDHPYIAQIPETLYLKCIWARLEEGW